MREQIPLLLENLPPSYEELFWARTRQVDECMEWQGALSHGYGRVRFDGRIALAHRVAYVLKHGAIPAGKVLDHLCRNPRCVRPDHLEAVTYRENGIRGVNPTFRLVREGRCSAGHPRSTDGKPYIDASGAKRWRCVACEKQRESRRSQDPVERAKKRERMRRLREQRRSEAAPTRSPIAQAQPQEG